MISNIPQKRFDERFTVLISETGYITVLKNGRLRVDEFSYTDTYALECLLQAVLNSGVEQGKKEIRLALGMKE